MLFRFPKFGKQPPPGSFSSAELLTRLGSSRSSPEVGTPAPPTEVWGGSRALWAALCAPLCGRASCFFVPSSLWSAVTCSSGPQLHANACNRGPLAGFTSQNQLARPLRMQEPGCRPRTIFFGLSQAP